MERGKCGSLETLTDNMDTLYKNKFYFEEEKESKLYWSRKWLGMQTEKGKGEVFRASL